MSVYANLKFRFSHNFRSLQFSVVEEIPSFTPYPLPTKTDKKIHPPKYGADDETHCVCLRAVKGD